MWLHICLLVNTVLQEELDRYTCVHLKISERKWLKMLQFLMALHSSCVCLGCTVCICPRALWVSWLCRACHKPWGRRVSLSPVSCLFFCPTASPLLPLSVTIWCVQQAQFKDSRSSGLEKTKSLLLHWIFKGFDYYKSVKGYKQNVNLD